MQRPTQTEYRHYSATYNPPSLFHFSNHRINGIVNIEHGILRTVTTLLEYHTALLGTLLCKPRPLAPRLASEKE